jgi:hypothetical protein
LAATLVSPCPGPGSCAAWWTCRRRRHSRRLSFRVGARSPRSMTDVPAEALRWRVLLPASAGRRGSAISCGASAASRGSLPEGARPVRRGTWSLRARASMARRFGSARFPVRCGPRSRRRSRRRWPAGALPGRGGCVGLW